MSGTQKEQISRQSALNLKLDKIEELLNAVSISLDDLRDDIFSMNKEFSSELDGANSDIRNLSTQLKDVQEDLEGKIDSCEEEINSVNCTAADAYEMAENLQSAVCEIQEKYDKLDSEVADVLLLKD